jgi:hypothetical protein
MFNNLKAGMVGKDNTIRASGPGPTPPYLPSKSRDAWPQLDHSSWIDRSLIDWFGYDRKSR